MSDGELSLASFVVNGKEAEAWATVLVGNRTTLQLDLDSDDALLEYERRREKVTKLFNLGFEIERWRSKSGVGWHVIIEWPAGGSVLDRAVVQLALGSDYLREAIAVQRFRAGITQPFRLFRPRSTK